MKLARAELYDGQTINFFSRESGKIGEGVEKEFFQTENDALVIGFYKGSDATIDPNRLRRLTYIVEKYNVTRTAQWSASHFCWPVSIAVSPRLGVVTPKLPQSFYFKQPQGEKKSAWFLQQRLIQKLPPKERGHWLDKFQICRHLCQSFGRLHAAGLAHSDISGNNILMDPRTGSAMLLDIDSLVVPGVLPPRVLGTDRYMAPEIVATRELELHHPHKRLPCINTDLHSLAVLIYETLLLRHPLIGPKIHSKDDPDLDDNLMLGKNALFIENPHDISNRPKNIPVTLDAVGPYLKPLFERAFIHGLHDPHRRPSALEWEEALTATTDILYPCGNAECWQKWFVCQASTPLACPFCGRPGPVSVPMMRFFRKYRKGQYIPEGKDFVIYPQKIIHPWHTRTNIRYPNLITSAADHEGVFIQKNERWLLKNQGVCKWFISSGQVLRQGSLYEIRDQDTLLLDEGPDGRLAFFQFLSFNPSMRSEIESSG